jgi:hypothetical protein
MMSLRPPRGRFSHLAMFRLGAALFIPAYLTVILYRAFASPTDDGNIILMTGESFHFSHLASCLHSC